MQITTMADTCLNDQLAIEEQRAHLRVLNLSSTTAATVLRAEVFLEVLHRLSSSHSFAENAPWKPNRNEDEVVDVPLRSQSQADMQSLVDRAKTPNRIRIEVSRSYLSWRWTCIARHSDQCWRKLRYLQCSSAQKSDITVLICRMQWLRKPNTHI